jgi:hypothetical protein
VIDAQEIVPNLWMGSAPPQGRELASKGFQVVTLCAFEHQPTAESFPGVAVARIDLDDAELSGKQFFEAVQLAQHLASAIRNGEKVLITCAQGRNRSGLITALTICWNTGCSGRTAVKAVQLRRKSPFGPALTNSHYVKALSRIDSKRNKGFHTEQAARAAGVIG